MEKNIGKSDSGREVNSFVSNEEKLSEENKTELKKKDTNSWDCSTSTPQGQSPMGKANDWDSISDCQETMVEPFVKDGENWDSESESKSMPKFSFKESKEAKQDFSSSSDSLDLSLANLSDIDKSSSNDTCDYSAHKKNSKGLPTKSSRKGENDLLIEDLEEFVREESLPKKSQTPKENEKQSSSSTGSKKIRSIPSEGTREDTTIWMIPKSRRTQSADSTSQLLSDSEKEEIENSRLGVTVAKAKSLSGVQRSKRQSNKSSRSDCLGLFDYGRNLNNFLVNCEGSSLQRKIEIKPRKKNGISGSENFDRTRVFFTEYECRAMTMDKEEPMIDGSAVSEGSIFNDAEMQLEADQGVPNEDSGNADNRPNSEVRNCERVLAGPSASTSLDVVSLPDMTGRNSLKEKPMKEKFTRRRNISPESKNPVTAQPVNESWFLLDETGQYQVVTRNEVTILLNGRSADAVLQGKKEHVIPNATLTDTTLPQGSLSGVLTKESLQYFLREEDTGGEDCGKRLINLERKMENTLLYIQPGMNLTASIRIIPVDTEMVHIWRRTRGSGSLLSSEFDLGLHLSQEFVENSSQRSSARQSSFGRRMSAVGSQQQTVAEQDETQLVEPLPEETQANCDHQEISTTDYSTLLIETRLIVDDLTNNFKKLQSRLDGETNRSSTLQGEVNKLRHLLKNIGGKNFVEKNSRETIIDQHLFQTDVSSSASILTVKTVAGTEGRSVDLKSESIIEEEVCDEPAFESAVAVPQENIKSAPDEKRTEKLCQSDSGYITVNIYTMDDSEQRDREVKVQDTNSLLQANLGMIEGKMQHLQKENDVIAKQNSELRKKLKEISQELEKYLASSSDRDSCNEEDKEMEALRDQVCNLKLELDTLKKIAWNTEENLKTEKYLIHEEQTKKSWSLKEWEAIVPEISQEIEISERRLRECGIALDINFDLETKDPKIFSKNLDSYLQQITEYLLMLRNEIIVFEQTLKEATPEPRNKCKEMVGLDQMISGYTELIEHCQRGSGDAENKVVEDYFMVIMEKASLMEEIKILKTENEILLENQVENHEKLKQAMISLKDRKSEITTLESSHKLAEEEKSRMAEKLGLSEEEKKKLEYELSAKTKTMEELMENKKERESEANGLNERLNAAGFEIKKLEKSCRLKDEMIHELKMENEQLLSVEGIRNNQIEIMKEEIDNLEVQRTQLESELTSTRLFLNESQKEMTEYITHLETIINNSQEGLEKIKQKLKESNQTISKLKKENDSLDHQHNSDLKLFNQTKDELECCKRKLAKFDELEEDREKLIKNFEILAETEKEKSEALEMVARECKMLLNENTSLREKVDLFSKDKDESLKEQKDLINKYAILSKEVQKLQEKYRNVKAECNERTNMIRHLEIMLKENLLEYNNRIACLEKNISHIIEKIAACKNCMKGKDVGLESEVRELRRQLDITYQERKELEDAVSNYYSLMKHLENEIQEREKKMDEMHVKLSLEQQKASDCEIIRSSSQNIPQVPQKSCDSLKIKELENQIAAAESELFECRKELQICHNSFENEKKKMELTITDLNSEINRYRIRIEVMMRNLSNCNKTFNDLTAGKRNAESELIKKELEEKENKIKELHEAINKYKVEIRMRDSDLENSKKKNSSLEEELKNLKNQFSKMEDVILITEKKTKTQQKEKEEMTEKLLESIKLLMEEKSGRQTLEFLVVEKEKNLKDQIDHLKIELVTKSRESEALTSAFEEKKKLVNKLQEDLKKMKSEVASLKAQLGSFRRKNSPYKENNDGKSWAESNELGSPMHTECQSITSERMKSCMRELKEIRDLNLQLRKAEGQHQAKIVKMEDEIRDARLLIKELQGDIKTEKKSKKAFKNMIVSAKIEIEKCLSAKQIISIVADKINRHLDLSEIPSRELLSGFRLSDSGTSLKYVGNKLECD